MGVDSGLESSALESKKLIGGGGNIMGDCLLCLACGYFGYGL